MKLPSRSKQYGVGKEIGGAVYVHRSSEDVLGDVVARAKAALPADFEYAVVKLTKATGVVSFVAVLDFDEVDEPTVGEILTVAPDGATRTRVPAANPEIYHHKWLFVPDDYAGFDVEASRQRSEQWIRLPGVDARRIGRRRYWEEHVVPRIPDE